MRGFCLLALFAASLQAGPSSFYIVSESFSDNGPAFYYRILDVKPDGNRTVIRYTRIAPTDVFCRRTIVQSATVRVSKWLIADPCKVDPKRLGRILRSYHRRAGTFETISFGIVAACEGNAVAFRLPISDTLDFERLQSNHPEIARLWDLPEDIQKYFGGNDVFQNRSEAEDLAHQLAGELLIPELMAGRYDQGLTLAAGRSQRFSSRLSDYRGPFLESQLKVAFIPQLLNAYRFRFLSYTPSVYPPLAKQARIEGKVDLKLSVDPETGDVQEAVAVSGHPILIPAATAAAKKWRFEPGSLHSTTIKVTLDFAFRCQ